jgi:hypothetical protein
MFNPNVQQMSTVIRIQHRTKVDINGADEIKYISEDNISFCNWKGMGGTESTQSGTLVVYDTAQITMWYDPNIKKQDRVLLDDDENLAYEIINQPENIEMRNMFLLLKVQKVSGA